MSLRAFHMIFITVVTLFCLAVAVWSLVIERDSSDLALKVLGYSCAVSVIVLPIYAVRFYKKSASNFS